MKNGGGSAFRDALVWHMEQHGTKISEIVAATGVSRDVLNKLLARAPSSTSVENAVLIAAFYGKSVEQFIRRDTGDGPNSIAALAELLTPDEEAMLAAQVRGILAARGPR